jgi:prolycopene isomerase
MIRLAERVVPGLSEHVVLRIGAYPGTMERYTLNQRGAMYGWAPSPSQATGYRLENLTPVTGLILAGHWTQPGAAVTMATASGARVAQYLLGYERIDRMFGELERTAPATTATA